MKRSFDSFRKRLTAVLLSAALIFTGVDLSVPVFAAEVITLSETITINSNNKSQYDGKTITGTTTDKRIIIDGVAVSLTIRDLDLQLPHSDTDSNLMHAGIDLNYGASLTLTLEGTNIITGGNMHAAIDVEDGCSLTINGSGSLKATGGTGSAGIGGYYVPRNITAGVGRITINGGNIEAYGSEGGSGIGGTDYCTKGSVEINGGTVYAKGSASQTLYSGSVGCGIGGGIGGHLESITINGGTVTAVGANTRGGLFASAIGAGPHSDEGSHGTCGTITINGGTVDAQSVDGYAIGFPNLSEGKNGSVTIKENASVNLNGGRINPMAEGWGYYTYYCVVYGDSPADASDAVLSIGDNRAKVTPTEDESYPYCWRVSKYLCVKKSDFTDASFTIGDKNYTLTNTQVDGGDVSLTFGTQEYLYFNLDITINDKSITADQDVQVSIGGKQLRGTLKKTAEYQGNLKLDNCILPIALKNRASDVTVTSGSKTWTGTAPAGTNKTFSLGTPVVPDTLEMDISLGDVTFSEGSGGMLNVTYTQTAGSDPITIPLDRSKVYEVIQSDPAATEHRLIFNTPLGAHVRIRDLNLDNSSTSPVEISGSVKLETAGSSLIQTSEMFCPAIHVPFGSKLELTGSGELTAASNYDYGSGIGSKGAAFAREAENSGEITISSGTVTATGGHDGAGIGGGHYGSGSVIITGGIVTATGGFNAPGIGAGEKSSSIGTVTIRGGTITAEGGSRGPGIGKGYTSTSNVNLTITGGTVNSIKGGSYGTYYPVAIENPKNGSGTALTLFTVTLEGAGDDVLIAESNGFGKDVYTRDSKLYFYLPEGYNLPATITAADGLKYNKGENNVYSPEYYIDLIDYNGKEYDGTPLENPTEEQVESNADGELTFEWYQDDSKLDANPVNAGSYKLIITAGSATEEFPITISQKPLTITANNQGFFYGGTIQTGIEQVECSGLAEGDTLSEITISADKTDVGEYKGAIVVSNAVIMRGDADVTANYEIAYDNGDLIISALAVTVDELPTATAITYGQTLSESKLNGGSASDDGSPVEGTFEWKDGTTTKPSAGTAEYEVIFKPTDTNYSEASCSVEVTVDKALLTIEGAAIEPKTYSGDTGATVTGVTFGGVVPDENLILDTDYTATAEFTDGNAGEGNTAIVTVTLLNGNYTFADGKNEAAYTLNGLTISPKAVTGDVTVSGEYEYSNGAEVVPAKENVTVTYTENDKTVTISPDEYTFTCTDNINAGNATLTLGDVEGGNYTVSGTGSFEIAKVEQEELIITPLTNVVYGNPYELSTSGGSGDGAVLWEVTKGSAYGQITGGNVLTITGVGEITVTATKAESTNYKPATADMTVTGKPRPISISGAEIEPKIYNGDTSATVKTVTFAGVLEDDVVQNYTASAVFDNANAGTGKTVTITVDDSSLINYALEDKTFELKNQKIEKAPQTLTVPEAPFEKTYGDEVFPLGCTTDGDGTISYAVGKGENVVTVSADGMVKIIGAGTAEVTVSLAEGTNYTGTDSKPISITVAKKAVNVPAADNTTFTYNGKEQTYTIASSDLYKVEGNKQKNAGTYDVKVTLNDPDNYEWKTELPEYKFVIEKASVTITADSFAIKVGDKLPTYTYKPTGLMNGETLPIKPVLACEAKDSKIAGDYEIAVSGDNESANYTFKYVSGTLTISNKEVQTITADDIALTYGDTNGRIAVSGNVGALSYTVKTGEDVISVDASGNITTKAAGTATVEITAAETAEYAVATVTIAVAVEKAAVTITADSFAIKVGDKLPTYTYKAAGLVNGDTLPIKPVLTCNAANSETVGTYDIVAAGEAESANYKFSYVNGTLTVSEKLAVAAPVIDPNGGRFSGSQKVTITCATEGADIYYTTDGKDPTTASNKYTGAFSITKAATVKAIAVKDNMTDSKVVSAVFTKKSGGGSRPGRPAGPTGPSEPTDPKYPSVNGKEHSWTEITNELKKLSAGGKLTIDLNGNTTVPADVIAAIANKDAVVTFVLNTETSYVVDGARISGKVSAADLSVGTSRTTLSTTNVRVIGGTTEKQFTLGNIGIPAKTNFSLDKANAGKFASLMKLNSATGKYEFVSVSKIAADGKALVDINGKGDYLLIIDSETKKPGDLNSDMITNALDASELLKSIVYEFSVNSFKADYNGDGTANTLDASEILQTVVGLVPDRFDLSA